MSTNKEIKIIINVTTSRYQRDSCIGWMKLNDERFTYLPQQDVFINDKYLQQFNVHIKRGGLIKDFE